MAGAKTDEHEAEVALSSIGDLADLASGSVPIDLASMIAPAETAAGTGPVAALSHDEAQRIAPAGVPRPISDFERDETRPGAKKTRLVDRGEIARGGMGSIRRVFDRYIMRYAAVKVLDPQYLAHRPDAPGRFLEEAQITGQLDHPNICPVHDLGVDAKGLPQFFSDEARARQDAHAAPGRAQPRRPHPRDYEQLLQIVLKICDAVAFAHSQGVIHRDLKPDNIMIGSFGQVYVMDWGCALVRPLGGGQGRPLEHAIRRTPAAMLGETPGTVVGSGSYMAPEQAWGKPTEIDARSDVFAMGAMLYKILTKQPPFRATEFMEAVHLAQKGEIAEPQTLVPHVKLPAGLCRIAMRALAKEPGDRYQTVEALKQDIERFLRGGSWFAERSFPAGALILREGDPGDAAYIITRGRCEAFKEDGGKRTPLRQMGAGEVFGETAIFTAQPRTASVIALEDLTAVEITRDALEQELVADSWMGAFVRALAGRFRDLDAKMTVMRRAADRTRVVTWIRDYVGAAGKPVGPGIVEAEWSRVLARLRVDLEVAPDEALAAVDLSEELSVDAEADRVRLESPALRAAHADSAPPPPAAK